MVSDEEKVNKLTNFILECIPGETDLRVLVIALLNAVIKLAKSVNDSMTTAEAIDGIIYILTEIQKEEKG